MIKENLRDMIDAGAAKIPADIVIKNGQLVNVTSSEIYPAGIAIYRSRIVATGDVDEYIGDNTQIIDAENKYLVPGLIDGHLHIECSKMSMTSFAKAVVPCGTTSIVSGLDQYLVTAGLEGVREVLDEIKEGPLKVFWGLPFTAPYTLPESTIGFNVTPEVHQEVQKWPEVYGVWETVSEFVENKHDGVMKAIELAQENNLPVFGCAPMTTGTRLNSVLCAGVRLDHESYDHQEAMEKIRKGMFLLIRESSISHFLNENMKVVTHINPRVSRRVSFCTDDVIPSDILENGHMDKLIRMTIAAGVDPITAIQMGSLNSAEAYRIDHLVGSISPGKIADILFVDDLREFKIDKVIAKGKLAVDNGKMAVELTAPERSEVLSSQLQIPSITPEDMKVRTDINADRVNVLSMEVDFDVPFVRKRRDVQLKVENGVVLPDVENDVLYATVVERFGKNGNKPVAFVSGWKMKAGAMASSKAPDDNNVVCIGTNSEDMSIAINYIAEMGGGQVIVKDGEILDFIHLPICGVTSDIEPEAMAKAEIHMKEIARELGSDLPDPVFYMCCLQITAIPDYALTDLGAVDFHAQNTFDPVLGAAE